MSCCRCRVFSWFSTGFVVPCVVSGGVLLVVSPLAVEVSLSGSFLENLRLRLYLFLSVSWTMNDRCSFADGTTVAGCHFISFSDWSIT